jgi:catechol 2,3-dioxygenase-like lactoylglutathione lyase family enzyme
VADLDRAIGFYTEVLDFKVESRNEIWGAPYEEFTGVFGARARRAELRLGSETFVLTEFLTPRGRAIPPDSRSNDRWFQHIAIVVRDIDEAYARLRAHGVRHVSTGPQTLPDWNPNAGGIRAFYFQDPDGHNLELIWFPAGKGDPRWQRPDDRLFLGIDHTAIAVGDTERSLGFYRDLLGLHVAGTSENWGTEQEHLNLVFGARLRITGLRGDGGPGIEFLEYLAPADGRPAPDDLAANDLANWQIVLTGDPPETLAPEARRHGGRLVSAGVAEFGERGPGYRKAALIRDPDGHAVALADVAR